VRAPPLRETVPDLPVLVAVRRAVGRVEHRMKAAAQALRIVLAGLQVVAGPARSGRRGWSCAQLEERAVAELKQQDVRMPVVVHKDHAVDCATHAEILNDERCNVSVDALDSCARGAADGLSPTCPPHAEGPAGVSERFAVARADLGGSATSSPGADVPGLRTNSSLQVRECREAVASAQSG